MLKQLILITSMCSTFILGQDSVNYNFSEQVNLLCLEYEKLNLFSGNVLIVQDDKILFENIYGYSDFAAKEQNDLSYLYNIGAIGKDFTAILILQLMESGALALDDSISKYLDGFAGSRTKSITIRQLLQHRSGMGDILLNSQFAEKYDLQWELVELLDLIRQDSLLFDPGTSSAYSNSGYIVLGAIIEQITGKYYRKLLSDNILNRIGLESTYYENPPADRIAFGHIKSSTGSFYRTNSVIELASPASGIYSSVHDLYKLTNSIIWSDTLITGQSKLLLYSQYARSPSVSWEDYIINTNRKLGRVDGIPGYNTVVYTLPVSQLTVVLLSNINEPFAEIVANNIMTLFVTGQYNEPVIPATEKIYDQYSKNDISYLKNNFFTILESENYGPADHGILNKVGYDLLRENRIDEALDIFRLNVELFPDNANTYDSLGEAYLMQNNFTEAKTNYSKSLELDPDNINAIEMLDQINILKLQEAN